MLKREREKEREKKKERKKFEINSSNENQNFFKRYRRLIYGTSQGSVILPSIFIGLEHKNIPCATTNNLSGNTTFVDGANVIIFSKFFVYICQFYLI